LHGRILSIEAPNYLLCFEVKVMALDDIPFSEGPNGPRAEFVQWIRQVDFLLQHHYGITLDDAGLSEQQRLEYWSSGGAPFELVEWYALKYNLDRVQRYRR
jgi:hypothetical protein